MKLVTAIIKPFKLDEVREALSAIGVHGITVTEVSGFRPSKGHTEAYRGAEYVVDFPAQVKIEAAVQDDILDQVIEAIEKSASTGKIGDGKIFVFDLEQAIRIPYWESGADAPKGAFNHENCSQPCWPPSGRFCGLCAGRQGGGACRRCARRHGARRRRQGRSSRRSPPAAAGPAGCRPKLLRLNGAGCRA